MNIPTTIGQTRFRLGKPPTPQSTLEHIEAFLRWSDRGEYLRIFDYRSSLLRALLRHAFDHVSLYRHLWTKFGITLQGIETYQDLRKLPTVDKATFLYAPPNEILATNLSAERRKEGITSGSTAQPFRHFLDRKFRFFHRANLYRPWRWAGVDPNALTIHCSAPHASANTPKTLFLHPHFIYEKKSEYIAAVRSSGAKLIRGYPLTNFELGWMLKQEGCHDISFSSAFFVGHALSNGIREFFQREFNCEVFQYYASQETGPIAAECKKHYGMHIHEEYLMVEILDKKDQPVPEGERGRIVITSLLNEVMPLIRYEIEDIGLVLPSLCPCGRTSRRLLVEGRREDMLMRPDGQPIYPGIIRDILDKYFEYFQRYQMIQINSRTLLLRLVPAPFYNKQIFRKAFTELTECIGPDVEIEVQNVQTIPPLPNGKYQYFVSELWHKRFPRSVFSYQL